MNGLLGLFAGRKGVLTLGALGIAVVIAIITITGQIARGQDALAAEIGSVKIPYMVKVENAADLPDTAFVGPNGESVTLADFRGKVVLLNFWATWCPPCIKEMPALDRLAAAVKDTPEVAVVVVNEDRDGRTLAPKWLAEQDLPNLAPYVDEKQALARGMGLRGMPTTYLIGKDGTKLAYKEGVAEWDDPEFVAALKALAAR